MRIFVLIALLMAFGASAALAQVDADRQLSARRDICLEGSTNTTDQRIAACNDAIGSNWYQGRDLARLYFSRSTLCNEKGDAASGLADLDAALKAWSGIVNNVINRSVKYLHEKKYDIAIADLDHAGAMTRFSYPILADRAAAHLHRGDLDAALADATAALSLEPDSVPAMMVRAEAEAERGDTAAALADLEHLQQLRPREESVYNASCYTLAVTKQDIEARALPYCEKAVSLEPDNAHARDSRGYVYLLLDRFDDAIADYDAALSINPKLAPSLYGRGLAKQRKGDAAGGAADIAAAEALDSKIEAMFGTPAMISYTP